MKTEELIAKYPKIFKDYEGNPYRCNWSGVPSGWLPIIDDLCGAIQDYIDYTSSWDKASEKMVHPTQVTCDQMKEKFGGLRFYESGGDSYVQGMIMMAEHLADNTCEECGSREEVGSTNKGWITTICRNCVTENGKIENWMSNKELKEKLKKRNDEDKSPD